MDPYRSDHTAVAVAEAPRDRGIVGDIIAQFADPLAFYRELIQNSIDAGSPSVDVRIEYDEARGVARAQVKDRGEGMTRDILENQLLVLFRSTKEKDDTKIGKFGIGFTSVLAPNPEVVAVTTAREGRRLTLHLQRDLTYQLFDAGPATQTGTTVEVDIAMRADDVEPFVKASLAALERWCRHASVPVTLTSQLPGHDEPATVRIDRPLGLDRPLFEVTRRSNDGKLIVVAGLLEGAAPYAGFFNHGLMLAESDQPLLGRVAIKLQDARLGHTLSRDDVRRDANFEAAMAFARTVVERDLPGAAGIALREACDTGDLVRWLAIATAICDARLELPNSAWWFPLVRGGGQAHAIDVASLPRRGWIAVDWSPLAARVVESGHPVLHATIQERTWIKALAKNLSGCELRDVETELTAVSPIEHTDRDVALLAVVRDLFAKVHRAPSAIVLAELDGLHRDVLALAGATEAAHVVERSEAEANPIGKRPRVLVISERHGWYRAARELDPHSGAALLVRVLLLHHDLLDVPRSTLLVEHILDRVLG